MTVNTTQTLTRPAANGDAASRPEQQTVIAGTRPRPSSSAGEVVVAYLRTQQQALAAHEGKVRADEYDAVHQMRVATRRLRAALRSFRQVIPRRDSEHLDAELQWLGHVLGRARDDEVLAAHLRDTCGPCRPSCSSGRSRPACKVTSRPGARRRTPRFSRRSTLRGTPRCWPSWTG